MFPCSNGAVITTVPGKEQIGVIVLDPASTTPLWPIALYAACVLGVVLFMVTASYFLGQRHRGRATTEPYESGIASQGSARVRFNAKYYLVAMFFLIFDLEAVFVFTWAVAVRELGWAGYLEILIFITVLTLALFYIWRSGGLDWGPAAGEHRKPRDPGAIGAAPEGQVER